MAAAVAAVEDAFLRGEWAAALAQSKEKLMQSIVQTRQRAQEDESLAMTTDEYVHSCIWMYDEVETATVIVQSFDPLSFDVNMQCWGQPRVLELLVFQILLPSESIDSVRKTIYSDDVLDEVSKQHMLERVDAFVNEHVRLSAASAPSSSARNASVQSSQVAQSSQASMSSSATNTTSGKSATSKPSHPQAQSDDDSSTYVMIGGAALALTFAAIGAIRYKDRLHEAVEGVVPAISKGLSDAKYALFDA
uniref:Uncharacterized protein n=1 Tax=Globisporangium ultimum (strain ATCC 200006 / CBS 805.95 / DAOM BR144) TaxID=431595 RepID=K3X3H9_GLOUD